MKLTYLEANFQIVKVSLDHIVQKDLRVPVI